MVSSELGNKFFAGVWEQDQRKTQRWIYSAFTEYCTSLHQKILRWHWLNSAGIGQWLKNFLRVKKCLWLKNSWCLALDMLHNWLKVPEHVVRWWCRSCLGMMLSPSLLRCSWLLCRPPYSGYGAGTPQLLHYGSRSSGDGWSLLLVV